MSKYDPPAMSPDGTNFYELMCVSNVHNGNTDLFKIKLNGKALKNNNICGVPVWSDDSHYLGFAFLERHIPASTIIRVIRMADMSFTDLSAQDGIVRTLSFDGPEVLFCTSGSKTDVKIPLNGASWSPLFKSKVSNVKEVSELPPTKLEL
jgi:hypothetical protein